MARMAPPAPRSGVSLKAVRRNLERIHAELPEFFERRQRRADLRHDWHRKQHAHALHYEAQKLLEYNLSRFPTAARREAHRLWARREADAHVRRTYHGH